MTSYIPATRPHFLESVAFTLGARHTGALIEMKSTTARTITIPAASTGVFFPSGSQITVIQTGSAAVTVAGGNASVSTTAIGQKIVIDFCDGTAFCSKSGPATAG